MIRGPGILRRPVKAAIPCLVLLLPVILAIPFMAPGGAPVLAEESAGRKGEAGPQRVLLDKDALYAGKAALLRKSGIRILADYGTYVLAETTGAEGTRAIREQGIRIRRLRPDGVRLRRRSIDLTSLKGSRRPVHQEADLHLLRLDGPARTEWVEKLHRLPGARILMTLPEDAFILWMEPRSHVALDASGIPVEFLARLDSLDRISPELDGSADPLDVTLLFVDSPAGAAAASAAEDRALDRLGAPPRLPRLLSRILTLSRDRLDEIAGWPELVWAEPYRRPLPSDELSNLLNAGLISGNRPAGAHYREWLEHHGLGDLGSFLIQVVDTGIDTGGLGAEHPALAGRLAFSFDETLEGSLEDCVGHGTHIAGIIAGNPPPGADLRDDDGFELGLGIAPTARIGSTRIFDCFGFGILRRSYSQMFTAAYEAGARISNNSWGTGGASYSTLAAEYDALVRDVNGDPDDGEQPMVVVVAAGNRGPDPSTIDVPGVSKNVITVGGSESFRPIGIDGCGNGPDDSDSPVDVRDGSSRGPTVDGRVKPDLMAPGTRIVSTVSQAAGFTGLGVCDAFWPPEQRLYTWTSGTSQSTAHVSGSAAIVMKDYENHFGTLPSPAMVKAQMVATARDLGRDASGNQHPIGFRPAGDSGWGRVDLSNLLEHRTRVAVDQTHLLTGSGEEFTRGPLRIADRSRPVAVVLAWTDAPGAPSGNSWVNDLDLVVSAGGETYLGNVLDRGFSVTGGAPDARNNVEAVFLPPGASGPVTVRVIAVSILGDGVPSAPGLTDQDFALYVDNAVEPLAQGTATFDRATYSCGDRATLRVMDRNLAGGGSLQVVAYSGTEPGPESFDLSEDPPGSGIFAGEVVTASGTAGPDGQVQVGEGDLLVARYLDSDPGDGQPVAVETQAAIRCSALSLTNVRVDLVGTNSARVSWTTDRPADSRVTGSPSIDTYDPVPVMDHSILLESLTSCSTLRLRVHSTDASGTSASFPPAGEETLTTSSGERLVLLKDDMESFKGGWSHSGDGDEWELGPPASGPGAAFSGDRVWGTDLDGTYDQDTDSTLTLGPIRLRDLHRPALVFQHFLEIPVAALTDDPQDAAWVEISTDDGATWRVVAPDSGYPVPRGPNNPYVPPRTEVFAGTSGTWTEERVDLSPYAGRTVHLRFRIWRDPANTLPPGDGWYLDDLRVEALVSCRRGSLALGEEEYGCSGRVHVGLTDIDLNRNRNAVDQTTVIASNGTDLFPLTLTETGIRTAAFVGELVLSPVPGPGLLAAAEGETISVTYEDLDDGTGAPRTVQASALVTDCTPPSPPTGLRIDPSAPGQLLLEWTDPPDADLAAIRIHYDSDGPGPIYSGDTAEEGISPLRAELGRRRKHLSGLPPCQPQFVSLTALDRHGNESAFSAEVVGVPRLSGPCARAQLSVFPPEGAGCSQDLLVTVLDGNTGGAPLTISASSGTNPAPMVVPLTEISPGTGEFTATVSLTSSGVPGSLPVVEGDEVRLVYIDSDAGGSGSAILETRLPVVDCQAPVITGTRLDRIGFGELEFTWSTDEPTTFVLEHGLDAQVEQEVSGTTLATDHRAVLASLPECVPVYYRVLATDRYGNTSVEDDGGLPLRAGAGRTLTLLLDDFESGAPGWTHGGLSDEWELGAPAAGPPGAFSGSSVWGLDLDGTYETDADVFLTSPEIDLTGIDSAVLTFHQWFDIYSSSPPIGLDDAGWLEVSADGGQTWSYVTPEGGYNDVGAGNNPHLPPLTPVYAGTTPGWEAGSLRLDEFAGQRIHVRFHLFRDRSPDPADTPGLGWYLDDFHVEGAVSCHAGSVRLDPPPHDCGGLPLELRLWDSDRNTDPLASDSVPVRITSDTDPIGFDQLLTETGPDTGAFAGTVSFVAATPGAGEIQVSDGGRVTATYQDQDDGTGAAAVATDSTAIGDCTAPTISGVRIERIDAGRVRVAWSTDEPSDSEVLMAPGGMVVSGGSLVLDHSLEIEGLQPCTPFGITVSSSDGAGNRTVDDNGGALYTLDGAREVPVLSESFEAGAPGWSLTGDPGPWEIGPPAVGPPGPLDGVHVAGTDLDGQYDKGTARQSRISALISPPFSLEGLSSATLEFQHFYSFEGLAEADGGVVEVLDGSHWTRLEPEQGYTGIIRSGRGEETMPAYTLESNGWRPARFDLSPFLGRELRIRFRMILDQGIPQVENGWYVDAVRVLGATACPRGFVQLDRDSYGCGPGPARVLMSDVDLNASPSQQETVQARAFSGSDSLTLDLTETGPDTGLFQGLLPLAAMPTAGALAVTEGETLQVAFLDPVQGMMTDPSSSDSALIADCTAPTISGVSIEHPGDGTDLLLRWQTDEPATTEALLSPDAGPALAFSSEEISTEHAVRFMDLPDCTGFTATLLSEDRHGNRSDPAAPAASSRVETRRRTVLFEDDMEGPNPGWTSAGRHDEWDRGLPLSGPPIAFSGNNVVGTDLEGLYQGAVDAVLLSPMIDLRGLSSAHLVFWHFFDVFADGSPNADDDGAWLEIFLPDSGSTVYVEPTEGYNNTIDRDGNPPIPGGSGVYAGNSGGWRRAVFDLTPFTDRRIVLQFHIWNDQLEGGFGQGAGFGWYLDDIHVSTAETCQAAPRIDTATPGDLMKQGATGVPLQLSGGHLREPLLLEAGSGVTIRSVTVTSPQSASALVDVDPHALTGARNLTARAPDGQEGLLEEAFVIEMDANRVDIDGNGVVDGRDLAILARAFGSFLGETRYDPGADIDGSGAVDGVDLAVLASRFGQSIDP